MAAKSFTVHHHPSAATTTPFILRGEVESKHTTMPLQEISNNYQRISAKKQTGKLSTKPSTRTPCSLPPSTQEKESHHGGIARKQTPSAVVESPIQAPEVFLESNENWRSWVSDDIQFWSDTPKFQNAGKTLCCLLCGKKVRGKEGDKELVTRHTNGDHHQKVFKILQNLKKLKDENTQRFDEMLKVVAAPRNSPDTSCTLKQRRAFYTNVAIQTLARSDRVATVVSPIRQRFLKNRVQETPAPEVEQSSHVEQSPVADGNAQENIAPGSTPPCEPGVDGRIQSPTMSKKEENKGIASTPFPGPRYSEQSKEPDSGVKMVGEPSHMFSPPTKSKAHANAAPRGVFLSPSSDVSEQSEIGWMGTIDELDFIVDGPNDTYDGKLDADLQQMIFDDSRVDDIMFGMPTMKITEVDNDTEDEKGDTESMPDDARSCMHTFHVAAENDVTCDVMECALDTKRSIECIAALSFAGFL
jgi:uncharacterized Zn finger protein (UPF0148 family)